MSWWGLAAAAVLLGLATMAARVLLRWISLD
jgi:hypothetical protein